MSDSYHWSSYLLSITLFSNYPTSRKNGVEQLPNVIEAYHSLLRRVPLQYISLHYRRLYYKSFAFAGDLRKSRNFNICVGLANSCPVTSYLRCKVTHF